MLFTGEGGEALEEGTNRLITDCNLHLTQSAMIVLRPCAFSFSLIPIGSREDGNRAVGAPLR